MVAGAEIRSRPASWRALFFIFLQFWCTNAMATPEEVILMKQALGQQDLQIQALMSELTKSNAAQQQLISAVQVMQSAASSAPAHTLAPPQIVDTRLLTKPTPYNGEVEGKEKWTTWSFKFKAYCAAMAPRMGELMEHAETQTTEILNSSMKAEDIPHSSTLFYVLSLLTEGEPFDIVRNTRVHHGLEAWRCVVQRWEPRVPARFRGMLQAVLFPRWDLPGIDATQAITSWEKQVRDYEQQSADKVSDAIKMGVVLHHLPDQSLREHLLLNASRYDTYDKVAAEVRQVTMARAVWSGPSPMDVSALQQRGKDTSTCTTCGKIGHSSKDCWFKDGKGKNKGDGKGKVKGDGKGKKGKKSDVPRKKGLCHNCGKEGHFARDCRSKKVDKTAAAVEKAEKELSYLGIPDGEEHWMMVLESDVECLHAVTQESVEFLIDSGAACHAFPMRTKSKTPHNGSTFVTASGETITSGGKSKVNYSVEASDGKKVMVSGEFEDLPVRRPLLSVGMLYEQGYDISFSKKHGCWIEKDGTKVKVDKKRGVFVMPVDLPKDLYPLTASSSGPELATDQSGPEVLPSGEMVDVKKPFVRSIPYTPTDQERLEHAATHIPFRVWCKHCCDGKARDWPHKRDYGPPPDIPSVHLDFLFINTDLDDDVLTVLGIKEKPGQAVGATALPDKSASEFAVAAVTGYLDFWGHNDVTLKCDQEPSMKKIVEIIKEKRKHRTLIEFSPKYSHQSNGIVESAHYHLQSQIRTLKSDFEEKTGILITAKSMMTPWLVRHAAWLITRYSPGPDGVTAYRRLRGKDYRGEVAEIGESVSYRVANKTQSKLDTRWESDGVFLGKTDNADEAIIGTPRGIEQTRSFRKREQGERWSQDAIRMFVGVPWNPRGMVADAPGGTRRRYITKALVVQHGATEGCIACAGDSQVHIPRCRKRFDDIFDAAKQPGEPRDRVPVVEAPSVPAEPAAAAPSAPSSSAPAAASGPATARTKFHATPIETDDDNMDFGPNGNVAPTTPPGTPPPGTPHEAKRRRGVGVDVEMMAVFEYSGSAEVMSVCELEPPEIDWDKLATDTNTTYDIYTGMTIPKVDVKLSRATEVENMLKFEVFEEVDEKTATGHRVWGTGWLDHRKTPTLVRSRLVAKQVRGASKREDVFAGTPPLGMMRYVISRAASRGRARCLAVYDVSVAFFHALLQELIFVRPPRDMQKAGIVWKLKKAMYGTQIAAKAWQQKVREVIAAGGWVPIWSMACVAYNATEDSLLIFHGDDFLAEGHDSTLDKLDVVLGEFELKIAKRCGPTGVSSTEFLRRKLGWSAEGFYYVPNPKYADNLIELLGLKGAKEAATPCSKDTGRNHPDALELLPPDEKNIFLSGSGTLQYLTLDRPDLMYATKEIRSKTTAPDVLAMLMLKRAARYLIGLKNVVVRYLYQLAVKELTCYTDSDWAGHVITRLSTTSGMMMNGQHWIDGWALSQKVRALSSAEAEFYSQGSGAARGLAYKHMCHETGEENKELMLLCDSSASRGILQRIGAGKCRHIETKWLWIQQTMDEKKMKTKAVRTEENVSDIGTKPLTREQMDYFMKLMMIVPAASLGCLTQPGTIYMLLLTSLFKDADATTQLTFPNFGHHSEEEKMAKDGDSYSFVFWLIGIIVMWEISKATLQLWTEKLLKATGLRAKSENVKVESSAKKDKTVKITTRNVGIQAQCTYKWKRETPRFHVLPDESTGAFV